MRMDNVDRLKKAKGDLIDLINKYNRIAYECYDREDYDGHAYWTERAFDLIEDYHKIDNDLHQVLIKGA